ncbi:hypothetical protein GCM10023231_41720 [Olivibacter ginsenosidimutans]|uniref:MobA-like NTP transferase domain-containing protein n=1 Tax=Olivibacter ginsenosidimutans TaxID=1176537 RepID=A0ABP9CC10_9SPHI
MDFAIIAAGEGSRLAKSGYPYPKPLAQLQGTPLIERLITIFNTCGADKIHIIINEASETLSEYLAIHFPDYPIRLVKQTTPSSLHSFYELIKDAGPLEALCVTTVDTIFKEDEFVRYLEAFRTNSTLDALMAVTPYVEDESPLYIETDPEDFITAFADQRTNTQQVLVSGGIYALRKKALRCVEKAIGLRIERMRNYQRMLLEEHLAVKAFIFDKIMDIDHLTDLQSAEDWLNEMKVS